MKTLEDHAGYREAWQRWNELKGELAEVRKQIAAATAELGRLPDAARRIRNEAKLLTSGGGPEVTDRRTDEIRGDLGDLYHRAEILAEAIVMQRRIVESESEKASKEICKAAGPEWRKRAAKIRDLCRQLAEVGQADSDFREDLRRSGVSLFEPLSDATAMTENLLYKLNHTADEIEAALKQ